MSSFMDGFLSGLSSSLLEIARLWMTAELAREQRQWETSQAAMQRAHDLALRQIEHANSMEQLRMANEFAGGRIELETEGRLREVAATGDQSARLYGLQTDEAGRGRVFDANEAALDREHELLNEREGRDLERDRLGAASAAAGDEALQARVDAAIGILDKFMEQERTYTEDGTPLGRVWLSDEVRREVPPMLRAMGFDAVDAQAFTDAYLSMAGSLDMDMTVLLTSKRVLAEIYTESQAGDMDDPKSGWWRLEDGVVVKRLGRGQGSEDEWNRQFRSTYKDKFELILKSPDIPEEIRPYLREHWNWSLDEPGEVEGEKRPGLVGRVVEGVGNVLTGLIEGGTVAADFINEQFGMGPGGPFGATARLGAHVGRATWDAAGALGGAVRRGSEQLDMGSGGPLAATARLGKHVGETVWDAAGAAGGAARRGAATLAEALTPKIDVPEPIASAGGFGFSARPEEMTGPQGDDPLGVLDDLAPMGTAAQGPVKAPDSVPQLAPPVGYPASPMGRPGPQDAPQSGNLLGMLPSGDELMRQARAQFTTGPAGAAGAAEWATEPAGMARPMPQESSAAGPRSQRVAQMLAGAGQPAPVLGRGMPPPVPGAPPVAAAGGMQSAGLPVGPAAPGMDAGVPGQPGVAPLDLGGMLDANSRGQPTAPQPPGMDAGVPGLPGQAQAPIGSAARHGPGTPGAPTVGIGAPGAPWNIQPIASDRMPPQDQALPVAPPAPTVGIGAPGMPGNIQPIASDRMPPREQAAFPGAPPAPAVGIGAPAVPGNIERIASDRMPPREQALPGALPGAPTVGIGAPGMPGNIERIASDRLPPQEQGLPGAPPAPAMSREGFEPPGAAPQQPRDLLQLLEGETDQPSPPARPFGVEHPGIPMIEPADEFGGAPGAPDQPRPPASPAMDAGQMGQPGQPTPAAPVPYAGPSQWQRWDQGPPAAQAEPPGMMGPAAEGEGGPAVVDQGGGQTTEDFLNRYVGRPVNFQGLNQYGKVGDDRGAMTVALRFMHELEGDASTLAERFAHLRRPDVAPMAYLDGDNGVVTTSFGLSEMRGPIPSTVEAAARVMQSEWRSGTDHKLMVKLFGDDYGERFTMQQQIAMFSAFWNHGYGNMTRPENTPQIDEAAWAQAVMRGDQRAIMQLWPTNRLARRAQAEKLMFFQGEYAALQFLKSN